MVIPLLSTLQNATVTRILVFIQINRGVLRIASLVCAGEQSDFSKTY